MAERSTPEGRVRISEEVVATIAGLAANEVPGVAGMMGSLVSGLGERLGRKNPQKGVKVELGEAEANLDLYLVVDYGARIPEVAQKVQEGVRQAVENMTGLAVPAVNIHVQGVAFPPELADPGPKPEA